MLLYPNFGSLQAKVFESQSKVGSTKPFGLKRCMYPQEKRFRERHILKSTSARPPDDYLYENLSYTPTNVTIRRIFVYTFMTIILLFAFGGVVALKSYQIQLNRIIPIDQESTDSEIYEYLENFSHEMDDNVTYYEDYLQENPYGDYSYEFEIILDEIYSEVCTMVLDECVIEFQNDVFDVSMEYGYPIEITPISLSFAVKDDIAGTFQTCRGANDSQGCNYILSTCYPCYCRAFADTQNQKNIRRQDVAEEVLDQCNPYLGTTDLSVLIIGLVVSGVAVGINQGMTFLLKILVDFEKQKSRTDVESALCIKLFAAQFINTAIVPILATAYIRGIASSLDQTFLAGKLFSSGYEDFENSWYTYTGAQILTTMVLNVLVQRGMGILDFILPCFFRNCLTCCGFVATQEHLNQLYLGPRFELSERAAYIMLNIGVAMLLGSGVPVLYLVASIAFMSTLFGEKCRLLKACRTPVRYSRQLVELIIDFMHYIVIIHLLVGIWMHSYFETEGEANDFIDTSTFGFMKVLGNAFTRLVQLNAIPLFVLLTLILVYRIVIQLMLGTFGAVVKNYLCCLCSELFANVCMRKEEAEGLPNFLDAYRVDYEGNRLLTGNVLTYDVSQNPNYEDAFYMDDVELEESLKGSNRVLTLGDRWVCPELQQLEYQQSSKVYRKSVLM